MLWKITFISKKFKFLFIILLKFYFYLLKEEELKENKRIYEIQRIEKKKKEKLNSFNFLDLYIKEIYIKLYDFNNNEVQGITIRLLDYIKYNNDIVYIRISQTSGSKIIINCSEKVNNINLTLCMIEEKSVTENIFNITQSETKFSDQLKYELIFPTYIIKELIINNIFNNPCIKFNFLIKINQMEYKTKTFKLYH